MPLHELGYWVGLALVGALLYLYSRRLEHETLRNVVQLIAFALGLYGIVQISYASYFGPVGQDPGVFWLSSGMMIGVLLSVERRWYIMFVLVSVVVHAHSRLVVHQVPWDACAFWTTANVVEGVIGSLLLRKVIGGRPDITQPRVFLLFCLLCAGAATAVSAAIGTAALALIYGEVNLFADWQVWWFSNALGVLSLGTVVLACNSHSSHNATPMNARRYAEGAAMLVMLLAVAWVSVGPVSLNTRSVLDHPYLVLPFLIWAALRFDARIASIGALVIALVTVYTANGTLGQLPWLAEESYGPFRVRDIAIADVVLAIQAFLFATLFATNMLVALTAQRNRAESETLEVRVQLYEAQRLESVAQLAGGIAHDLNNLLTVISLYRDQVEDRVGQDPALAPALQAMDYASENASALSRSLLDLSRHDHVDDGPVDVSACVRRAMGICRPLLPASIRLHIEVEPGMTPVIHGNANHLQQVVINLVLNARDAMMPGAGALNVWIRLAKDKPNFVELAVQDDGVGITPENLNHIFEPLFTTKPHGQGTGLGLSIVRTIIAEHGGEVKVFSKPGRGTTVRVLLPLVTESKNRRDKAELHTGLFVPTSSAGADNNAAQLPTHEKSTVLLLIANHQVCGALSAEMIQQGWLTRNCGSWSEYEAAVKAAGPKTCGVIDLRATPNPALALESPQSIPTLLIADNNAMPTPQDPQCKVLQMPFKIAELRELLQSMG